MGVDFIQKTARTFEKHLDLARARLGTADLFTRAPVESRPAFAADAIGQPALKCGQELNVELDGDVLVLRDGLRVVARASQPASAILDAVVSSSGIATGVVQEIHELSGVVEVTLC